MIGFSATASSSGAYADIGPVSPGMLGNFQLNCAALLNSGDSFASVEAGVQAWGLSPVADSGAAALLRGQPALSGSTASAWVGGTAATSNFVAGAVYSLVFQLTTTLGAVVVAGVNITIGAVSPPAFSGSSAAIPSSNFDITQNFTPAVPGVYRIRTAGVTMTIPSVSVGGDIVVVDGTGQTNPNFVISGSLLNQPNLLSPLTTQGFSFTLHWFALDSGYLQL